MIDYPFDKYSCTFESKSISFIFSVGFFVCTVYPGLEKLLTFLNIASKVYLPVLQVLYRAVPNKVDDR